MICANCQAPNPENARFCVNCGYSIAAPANCPNCGANLVPGARFCHNCGYALAPAAADPLADRLQKFIPKELLSKLQAARAGGSLEGERRVVTILFCDVTGSTALAERLDPEEWAEIMNRAFEYLIPPVFRYEGTVPRLMGDAILAFFGAPIAHEDDPERAVRAGLEILEGIRSYREQVRQAHGLDFDVRVGINTGLVVTGEVGSDLRLEYTAMGDAINLAARMEQSARPGTVQITAHTYRLVAPLFEVEPLGEIAARGKAEPVAAYRVLGLKPVPTRTWELPGLAAPLVGRQSELAVLRAQIARLRQGQGGILCLVGEAGLGKTRLIAELQREWEASTPSAPPGPWDVVAASSYAAARPYGQFRQHLLEHMGIRDIDPPEVVHAKISAMYSGDLAVLRPQALAVYSRLLGIDPPQPARNGTPALLPVEGEAFKTALFDLVLSFERLWMGGRPAVQVFDDLHWSDPVSAELLVHLFRLTRDRPVLYLCAFRPDPGTPAWSIRAAAAAEYPDQYTEIVLGPLSTADSRALIDHLLAAAAGAGGGAGPDAAAGASDAAALPPPALHDAILAKAEGTPLFIEEVLAELLARGDLAPGPDGLRWKAGSPSPGLAIPDSLHALLTARLDRLAEDARRTLQLASVIGRSFYYIVLQRIIAATEAAIALDPALQELQGSALIRESARQPELEFEFRHALTQEAAYRSILIRRRREYHLRVAEALEALFAHRLEDHADLLAQHFAAAGDSRARRYYYLAGNRAARIYAAREALAYYTQALEVPGEAPPEEKIAILTQRGEVAFSLGRFEAAGADFEAALDLARRAGQTGAALPGVEIRLLANLAWLRWSSGHGAAALDLAREAEAKSLRAGGDPEAALRAAIILGGALQNVGDIPAARRRFRRAFLASRRPAQTRMTASSLYYLATLENFAGRFGRSVACARQSHRLALRLGDRLAACGVLFYESLAEGGRGRYDQALAVLEEGRRLAEQVSPLWLARYPNQRAWLSAELGDWETAYAIDQAGLHPAQALPGFREIEISTLINLVLDCLALGRYAEAEAYLAEAQKDLGRPEFGSHNWRWSLRLDDARARLELARGDHPAAARSISTLLDAAGRTEARKYTLRGLLLRARLQLEGRAFPAAEAGLLAALRLADGMCYPPGRVAARLGLARLHEVRGEAERAAGLIREADALIAARNAQIHHPELRQSLRNALPWPSS